MPTKFSILKYPAFVLIAGYFLFRYFTGKTVCLFKNITTLPCPSCGSTRTFLKLLKGDFLEAMTINPLAIIFLLFFIVLFFWFILDRIRKRNRLINFLKRPGRLYVKILFFVIILINWIWNIKKCL